MIRTLMAATAIGLAGYAALAQMPAATISGVPRVVDGDSLVINRERIRLAGIDAPESAQTCGDPAWPCGQKATEAMRALVAHASVSCTVDSHDRYGRVLGHCTAPLVDLNRAMVTLGMAVAYRRYSLEYVAEEDEAKAVGRGIWSGPFTLPEQWRRQHPR